MPDRPDEGKFETKIYEPLDIILSNQMLGESGAGASGQIVHVEDLAPLKFEPGEPNPAEKTS